MKTWILASATALVAVAGLAANAAEPWSSPPMRGSPARPQIFPAAHAWVSNLRQETPAPRPAVVGHANIGQGGHGHEQAIVGGGIEHGAVAGQSAWNHEHQHVGYVFGPGSCDYTAPCVDHLWDGYCQRPHRCRPHGHHFHRGCGGAASSCGSCNTGCNTGCGMAFGGLHGCRLHGRRHSHGCGNSCTATCDTCNTGCGHGLGLGHFAGKCRGWFANLCNSCDGGMSCGCAAAVDNHGGPTGHHPEVVPTPSTDEESAPMVDDAKSARRPTINRYIPWSLK